MPWWITEGGLGMNTDALTALGSDLMRGKAKLEVRCGERHEETGCRLRD
jgi:hypothetical protein